MQFEQPPCCTFYVPVGVLTRNQKVAQCATSFPAQKQHLPLRVVSKGLSYTEVPNRKSAAPQFLTVLINCRSMMPRIEFGENSVLLEGRSG